MKIKNMWRNLFNANTKKNKREPKILILGYYGFHNTGDEAMLNALVTSLRSYSENIYVFSGDLEYTITLHKIPAIKRSLKFPEMVKDLPRRIFALKNSDLLIIGGGGLFNDKWHLLPFGMFEVFFSKVFNKKIVICGVDVGPYDSFISRLLARGFFQMVNSITVRSKKSADELKKLKIKNYLLSLDLTFLSEEGNKKNGKTLLENNNIPVNNLVGVSLRPFHHFSKKINIIAESLDLFIKKSGTNLLFIPFQYHRDMRICKEVISKMKQKNSAYLWDKESNFQEIKDIMSVLDFLIGMRLHSTIFSCLNKVPFFAISYRPKVKSFCEMFTEVLPYVELDDIKECKDFYDPLMTAYQNRKKYKKIISSNLDVMKEKANINIESIKKVMR